MATEKAVQRSNGPATDWRRLAARMRSDVDRAELTGRARRLAEVLVKTTLMRGRVRVVLPDREGLCRVIGIGAGHIGSVFMELAEARIADCQKVHEGWEVLVFTDAENWDIAWHYRREDLAAYLDLLDRSPGQVQGELIEGGPSLPRALAEVSVERLAADCVRPPPSGSCYLNGNSQFQKRELLSNRIFEREVPLTRIVESKGGVQRVDWARDEYVRQKLNRMPQLSAELFAHTTPLARAWPGFYAADPDRAREIMALAVDKRNPGAWLNVVVAKEAEEKHT